MKTSAPDDLAPRLIDEKIAALDDWRGETLRKLRGIILAADPEIVEQWKWGTPVWSRGGIVTTGETYKTAVKLTFAKGAAIEDPTGLFNSSLEGNVRRAIDVREGERINEAALKKLIRAAVAHNLEKPTKAKATKALPATKVKATKVPGAKKSAKRGALAPAKETPKPRKAR